jgi:glycosyltransferase involved in cell wall biosynthesis
MRIVVFSNLYPPRYLGGYELGAAGVVGELQRRGHEVLLLSSHRFYVPRGRCFDCVRHGLTAQSRIVDTGLCLFGSLAGFLSRSPIEAVGRIWATARARQHYRRAAAEFRPDAFLLFNPLCSLAPVHDDCAELARDRRVPAAAYVSDPWLAEWPRAHPGWDMLRHLRQRGRLAGALADGVLGRALAAAGLLPAAFPSVTHYLYCSDHLRRISQGKAGPRAVHRVVPWGLPEAPAGSVPDFDRSEPLALVYAGQIVEHKGLLVLLQALARCRRPHRLTVLGDDRTPYAAHCQQTVAELGLSDRVRFLGKRPHAEVPEVLAARQVLVLPSLWDEPFSLVLLEAMRAGLAVVASDTGGTPEAITDGCNGLLFPRGDSFRLAAALDRLEEDRRLTAALAAEARATVRERYTLGRMVDQFLSTLAQSEVPLKRAA